LGPFALSAYSPNGGALLHVNNQQFSSSILEMVTSRDPTPEFKIMKAISSKTKEVTFEVDGTGELSAYLSYKTLYKKSNLMIITIF